VTQPLSLKCDILVSRFAFNQWVNLYRYSSAPKIGGSFAIWGGLFSVGLYQLNPVDP
jgi:hypothetical protein